MQLQASMDTVTVVVVLLTIIVATSFSLWQQHKLLKKIDRELSGLVGFIKSLSNKEGKDNNTS